MTQAKQLYRFREENDNEGETWNFYVYLTEQEHDEIVQVIAEDECYSIQPETRSLAKIAALVEDADINCNGYMPQHQFVAPGGPVPKDADGFYKGQFWRPASIADTL